MATTKISALPAATSADAADLTIALNGSSDEKATVTQIATFSRAVAGATTVSAIVGSGSSLIINTALADSDTRIAGTTSANLFFVDAGLDKVGIATAVPTQKLDVTGTVNATLFAGSGASLTGLGTTSTAFRTVATDPSPLVNGDVWYNSTSDTFKAAIAVSAFAASATMSTARARGGGAGTASSAIVFGGHSSAAIFLQSSDGWNGTTWAVGGVPGAPSRDDTGGCGTATATLACAGFATSGGASPNSELYNGTSWSTTGAQIQGVRGGGGLFGTQTSARSFAGYNVSPAGNTNTVETFNGTTWASASVFPSTTDVLSGLGTSSSSGIMTCWQNSTTMYVYTGSWVAIASRATAVGWDTSGGTVSALISCGGLVGATARTATEAYNGTTWSAGSTMGTSRSGPMGGGSASDSVLVAGGNSGASYRSSTEILSPAAPTAQTFTVA